MKPIFITVLASCAMKTLMYPVWMPCWQTDIHYGRPNRQTMPCSNALVPTGTVSGRHGANFSRSFRPRPDTRRQKTPTTRFILNAEKKTCSASCGFLSGKMRSITRRTVFLAVRQTLTNPSVQCKSPIR